jgi:membrane-bound lytic murein transglycosylase B
MFLRFLDIKRELWIPALFGKCFWFNVLVLFWAAAVWLGPRLACAAEPSAYRGSAQAFAAEMAAKHGLDSVALADLMARARYRQDVIDTMRRPYESKPWSVYRALFLTPSRIHGGVAFWREHAALLRRAELEYGVPPEVIVAIVGVETSYGGNLGRHLVIDALSTLGFAYPPRADFFRGELEDFLLLARDESLDAGAVTGSYAGAVGKAQFIPSSYRAYAVDFDGDGRRDLWRSDADVIGSVANYLSAHGWRPRQPVAAPAMLTPEARAAVASGALSAARNDPVAPATPVGALAALGVATGETLDPDAQATLLSLDGQEDEYWVGLDNFYVITRYNRSNLYAMAVYQLGREIRTSYLARDHRQAAAQRQWKGEKP